MSKEEVLEAIKKLTVVELAELVKSLEEEFGVSAAALAAPAVAAGAPAAGVPSADSADSAEEKTEFNVLITEAGPNKINVIKAVRELTSLGLREAKELVESAPTRVKDGIPKESANQMKAKLEEAGATAAVE